MHGEDVSHTLIDIESPEAAMHRTANDQNMAKMLCERLQQHYPGHLWAVNGKGARASSRSATCTSRANGATC
jgi:hypothetical protein